VNGTLYIDRMATRSFMTVGNLTRYWRDKTVDEVRAALDPASGMTSVP
jgi:hypothetical protein